jgi:hypothetical protein
MKVGRGDKSQPLITVEEIVQVAFCGDGFEY